MIRWRQAAVAGVAGTIAFDVVGLLLTGQWSTPRMLGAKLEIGLAGGAIAHYLNGILLATIFAGVGPSLWGPTWARALTYMLAQQVFGVWLFLNPILGMGIAGLKGGPMVPIVSLAKHFAFGLVVAWLYPVAAPSTGGDERPAAAARPTGSGWLTRSPRT
jgi:hypothetical protein